MTGPASPWAPARTAPAEGARRRLRLTVRGAVQGVGFRPHAYRVATEAGLAGWVANDPRGVTLEVEGSPAALGRPSARWPVISGPRTSRPRKTP